MLSAWCLPCDTAITLQECDKVFPDDTITRINIPEYKIQLFFVRTISNLISYNSIKLPVSPLGEFYPLHVHLGYRLSDFEHRERCMLHFLEHLQGDLTKQHLQLQHGIAIVRRNFHD